MNKLIDTQKGPCILEKQIGIQYYGAKVVDCRADAKNIYVKVLPGVARIYGELVVFVLFCYPDSNQRTVFISQSVRIPVNEALTCEHSEPDKLTALVKFDPKIVCARQDGGNYIWNVKVSGEICVDYYSEDEKTEQAAPEESGENSRTLESGETSPSERTEGGTVVLPIHDDEILTVDTILEMDTEELKKIVHPVKTDQPEEKN